MIEYLTLKYNVALITLWLWDDFSIADGWQSIL